MNRPCHILAFLLALLTLAATGLYAQKMTPEHKPISLSPGTEIVPKIPAWPKKLIKMYDTIKITFIGDIMQHGGQIRDALIPGKDPSEGNSYDYKSAFRYTEKFLKDADIAVANMEFTLGTLPYTGYPQFSAPSAIAHQAKESGIDLFLLANNHILDKGERGLEKSLNIYDSLGVPYTGVYRDSCSESLGNPLIMEYKGVKIAFINFTYGTNGFSTPEPYIVNRMDSVKVKEVISRARERGAQMIIAMPHWGNEYQLQPSSVQREWSSMLFREGVKVIIGSHPHVPQSAEIYLTGSHHPRRYGEVEKMVFYSLGNYISNQSDPYYTQMGMMVDVVIVKNNLSGEITLSGPEWRYLWCFRKGELEPHYTVVPIEDMIGNSNGLSQANTGANAGDGDDSATKGEHPAIMDEHPNIKNNTHYRRMVNTFEYIRTLKPVKVIR